MRNCSRWGKQKAKARGWANGVHLAVVTSRARLSHDLHGMTSPSRTKDHYRRMAFSSFRNILHLGSSFTNADTTKSGVMRFVADEGGIQSVCRPVNISASQTGVTALQPRMRDDTTSEDQSTLSVLPCRKRNRSSVRKEEGKVYGGSD